MTKKEFKEIETELKKLRTVSEAMVSTIEGYVWYCDHKDSKSLLKELKKLTDSQLKIIEKYADKMLRSK